MSVKILGNVSHFEKLIAQVQTAKQKAVYVGIPAEQNPPVVKKAKKAKGEEKASNNFNMAALAAVLEFGNERIPSRPFLRQTLDENQAKYSQMFAEGLQDGKAVMQIYQSIALIAQADVQQNIVNGDWVANAPSTIKRKGSSKPLIDTGRLRQSVLGVVK